MILMGKSMVSGFDFPLNQSIDIWVPFVLSQLVVKNQPPRSGAGSADLGVSRGEAEGFGRCVRGA